MQLAFTFVGKLNKPIWKGYTRNEGDVMARVVQAGKGNLERA